MKKLRVFLLCAVPLLAQSDWTSYTNVNYINDLAIAGRFVYAATTGGLLKIDTATRSIEKIDNIKGLPSIVCNALSLDSSGNLWIGSHDGVLAKMDKAGKFQKYSSYMQNQWNMQHIICYKNYLVIAADKGLSLFSLSQDLAYQNFSRFAGVIGKTVRNTMVVDDTLFALLVDMTDLSKDTLAYIKLDWSNPKSQNLDDPSVWTLRPAPAVFSLGTKDGKLLQSGYWDVEVACGDQYEVTFGCTKNGSVQVLNGLSSSYTASFGNFIKSIKGDAFCRLWAGSWGGGVLFFNGSEWQGLPQEGPVENQTQYISMDRQGKVWITTGSYYQYDYGKGLACFDHGKWGTINAAAYPMLRNDMCTGVRQHPTKDITLISTWGGGIAILDSAGTWENLNRKNSVLVSSVDTTRNPDYEAISDLAIDAQGRLWAAVIMKGIAVMDIHGQGRLFQTGTENEQILRILFDSFGNLWAGYWGSGNINIYDTSGTNITSYYSLGTISGSILSLHSDSGGTMWIGAESGLYHYYKNDAGRDTLAQALAGEEIRGIAIAPRSAFFQTPLVFASSFGRGIRVLNTNMDVIVSYMRENSGLVSNYTNGLLFDSSSGELWIATQNGISVFRTDLFPPRDHFTDFKLARGNDFFRFDQIPDAGDIRIYTLEGALIRQIKANSQRDVRWYMNNIRNARVKPGIYYYTIQGHGSPKFKGKLIIR